MAKPSLWQRVFRRPAPLTLRAPVLGPYERECPKCGSIVTIWRTFGDGTIACVECAPK